MQVWNKWEVYTRWNKIVMSFTASYFNLVKKVISYVILSEWCWFMEIYLREFYFHKMSGAFYYQFTHINGQRIENIRI